jgi:hypothetical protein
VDLLGLQVPEDLFHPDLEDLLHQLGRQDQLNQLGLQDLEDL